MSASTTSVPDPISVIEAGPSKDQSALSITPGISDTMPIKLDGSVPANDSDNLGNDKAVDFSKFTTNISDVPDDIKAEEARAKAEAEKEAAEAQDNPPIDDSTEDDKGTTELPPTARPPKTAVVPDDKTSTTATTSNPIDDPAYKIFSKAMSKEAKQWVEARLKENQELTTKTKELEAAIQSRKDGELPPAWYEHPQAYELLPEVQSAAAINSRLKSVLEHYTKQLINIEEGDPWDDLTQDAQGNIGLARRDKPTSADKVMVQNRIAATRDAIKAQEEHIRGIVGNFRSKQTNWQAGMKKAEDYYFPQYSDPKSLEKNPDFLEISKVFKENHLDGDRMSSLTKKLYVWGMTILAENEKLKKAAEKGTTLTTMQRRAGPNGAMINQGSVDLSSDPDNIPFDPAKFARPY